MPRQGAQCLVIQLHRVVAVAGAQETGGAGTAYYREDQSIGSGDECSLGNPVCIRCINGASVIANIRWDRPIGQKLESWYSIPLKFNEVISPFAWLTLKTSPPRSQGHFPPFEWQIGHRMVDSNDFKLFHLGESPFAGPPLARPEQAAQRAGGSGNHHRHRRGGLHGRPRPVRLRLSGGAAQQPG